MPMLSQPDFLSIFASNDNARLATIFELKHYPKGFTFGPHQHKAIEINMVQKGDCYLLFGNDVVHFKKDDCMIIFPNVEHYFAVENTKTTLLQLEFELDIFPELKITPDLKSKLVFLHNVLTNSQQYMKVVNNGHITLLLNKIVMELNHKRDNYGLLIKLYYIELFILVSRHINETLKITQTYSSPAFNNAIQIINNNFCGDLSFEEIASKCNISSRYLRKIFKKYIDTSPGEYIQKLRINKAKEIISNQNISLKEIAYTIGYSNQQYFCKIFKQQTGLTPLEYRKKLFRIV